jgi:hypothetical protein
VPTRRTDAPQDDSREQDMLRVFGLRQETGSSRGDNDAFFDVSNKPSQCLELKSTTTSSLVTARDFGLQHINEWRGKHILGSFYDRGGNNIRWSILIPNMFLNSWLDEQLEYIKCDIIILEAIGDCITSDITKRLRIEMFGEKDMYTEDELRSLLKHQIRRNQYTEFLDEVDGGERKCSDKNVDAAIRLRTQYLLNRGTSRNNPHISSTWINNLVAKDERLKLDHPHGDYLRPKEWLHSLMEEYAIQ